MNIELEKLMDEKRLLDKEIDKLEEEIFHACENNQFDKAAALKEACEKKEVERLELRHLMLPLIVKPGYIWNR